LEGRFFAGLKKKNRLFFRRMRRYETKVQKYFKIRHEHVKKKLKNKKESISP